MVKRFIFIAIALLVPLSLVLGQTTGKIAGKVTDRETGDPLPGANVVIDGTTLGGATDVNGEFFILNIPVGSYDLKASFIGYQDVTLLGTRVSIGLTSEANFQLPSEALEVSDIEIVAQRPLVNKNATNEVHIVTAEQIENLPLRGYANVAGLQGGVIQIGGTLYVRGGRPEEVQFYVDGVSQNDPFTFNRQGDIINNSIEEVQVQSGGFNAEYGFANSGIIQVSTKTGGSNYSVSGEFITDEFMSKTSEAAGAFGYGYNLGNISISGPVPGTSKMKFYLAGELQDQDDKRRSAGIHPTSVVLDTSGNPVDIITSAGPLPNNGLERTNWNGNVTIDLRPLQFKIGGNSTRDEQRDYRHSFSAFNLEHNQLQKNETDSYFLKATHTLGSNTFWTATASFFRAFNRRGDGILFEDIDAYGDPNLNPELRQPGNNPATDDRLGRFSPAGTELTTFAKNESQNFALRADVTHQQGRTHEFKAGFEARFHTIRQYSVSAHRLASSRAANPDAPDADHFKSAFANNIGYDITGQTEVNSGVNAAPKPVIAAVYVQDKLEFQDLVLNLGIRWDYFKTDAPTFADPGSIALTQTGFVDESQLTGDETHTSISPRIGISFPVTDQTVFHAQFGKFSQPPELDRLFQGFTNLANQLQAGNFVTLNNPELKPVKTTSYEMGFRQQIGDNAALDITAYYKELRDLIQARNVSINNTTFATFINGDYGTIKGLSATFELRRTQRLAATMQYTLQFAGGTGSLANDAFAINWLGSGDPNEFPSFVAPLSFDQRHTGAINLDFRTRADDGPLVGGGHLLGRVGLNMLFTFHSGRPFTPGHQRSAIFGTGPSAQNRPQAEINSATMPFFLNLDAKLDKSFELAGLDFNVYVWAINLLGFEGVRSVYEQTGRPDTDGFLDSTEGIDFIENQGGNAAFYQARIDSPFNYEEARQYRLGLRFNWR